MTVSRNAAALDLFAPIAAGYQRWARILSMGQDGRWRTEMVDGLDVGPGQRALDVAAGTGSISRLLQDAGAGVVSLDQSPEMLGLAMRRGALGVLAPAESLPFADQSFDVVTFGYVLRYVDDVPGYFSEVTRVLRPGGRLGGVEFGRPGGPWRLPWWLYTRAALPLLGLMAGSGWYRVGRFLGPSIDRFSDRYPPGRLAEVMSEAGLQEAAVARRSLGGGLVMWGVKP